MISLQTFRIYEKNTKIIIKGTVSSENTYTFLFLNHNRPRYKSFLNRYYQVLWTLDIVFWGIIFFHKSSSYFTHTSKSQHPPLKREPPTFYGGSTHHNAAQPIIGACIIGRKKPIFIYFSYMLIVCFIIILVIVFIRCSTLKQKFWY